jgi:hypothetical protein
MKVEKPLDSKTGGFRFESCRPYAARQAELSPRPGVLGHAFERMKFRSNPHKSPGSAAARSELAGLPAAARAWRPSELFKFLASFD